MFLTLCRFCFLEPKPFAKHVFLITYRSSFTMFLHNSHQIFFDFVFISGISPASNSALTFINCSTWDLLFSREVKYFYRAPGAASIAFSCRLKSAHPPYFNCKQEAPLGHLFHKKSYYMKGTST